MAAKSTPRASDLQLANGRILVSSSTGDFIPCLWTRHAQQIFYWQSPEHSASLLADGLELFSVPVNGGAARSLNVKTLLHRDWIAESPTGESLVLVAGYGRETWERKRIAIFSYATRQLRYLTGDTTAALAPAWSPDGARIVYTSCPDAKQIGGGDPARRLMEQRRIHRVDAAGNSTPVRLTHDERYRDESPIWLANGERILFARLDRNDRAALWLMDAKGRRPVEVAGPLTLENSWFGFYGYIDWRSCFDWTTRSAAPA